MTYNVDYYLSEISNRSNRFGDKLLDLMNKFDKNCLKDITLDEAKTYYEELVKNENDK